MVNFIFYLTAQLRWNAPLRYVTGNPYDSLTIASTLHGLYYGDREMQKFVMW